MLNDGMPRVCANCQVCLLIVTAIYTEFVETPGSVLIHLHKQTELHTSTSTSAVLISPLLVSCVVCVLIFLRGEGDENGSLGIHAPTHGHSFTQNQ